MHRRASLRAGVTLAWAVPLLVLACTTRERANPLDPRNPDTHGQPWPPRVIPGTADAILGWEPLGVGSLTGYRIERRSEGESFAPVGPGDLPVSQLSLRDSPLSQHTLYVYRLVVIADDREVTSDSVEARTGPGSAWFLEETRLQLVSSRLPTGVDTVTGLSWPTAIDALNDGTAWVTDFGTGSVLFVDAEPSVAAAVYLDGCPVDVAAVEGTDRCWVVETWGRELLQISTGGILVRTALPDYPYSVAWSTFDGSVWVGHASGVTRFIHNGEPDTTYAEPTRPYRVSISPRDGSCWAADAEHGSVTRIPAAGGAPLVIEGFDRACDLSAETADGCCWVADCGADKLYLIGPDGDTSGTWDVPGIAAISACTGSDAAWAVSDDGLLRVGRDGQRECTLPGLTGGMVAATLP